MKLHTGTVQNNQFYSPRVYVPLVVTHALMSFYYMVCVLCRCARKGHGAYHLMLSLCRVQKLVVSECRRGEHQLKCELESKIMFCSCISGPFSFA